MISFVIPAYNAEKTIQRAVDSIINQSYKKIDYEIIIVNDGGTDNLEQKIEKYQNIAKVKYYKKENTGVADTRNYGVNKARGEYIIFVDSDDYISNTLLEDIATYINNKVDLIKWNAVIVEADNLKKTSKKFVEFYNVNGEQGFNLLFGKDNYIDCLWNYAIKKDIIVEFPKNTFHEDFAVMPQILLNAKTMCAIPKEEYYYVQSENSIIREKNTEKTRKKLEDKLFHFDNLINKLNNINIQKITKENMQIFLTNSMLVVIPELDNNNKKFFVKELKKRKIKKYIKVRNIKQLAKRIILELKY